MRYLAAIFFIIFGQLSTAAPPVGPDKVIMEIIETIPELEAWRHGNHRLWNAAVSEDEQLRISPAYASLSTRERLLIAVNRVKKADVLTVTEFPLYRLILNASEEGVAAPSGSAVHEWIKSLPPRKKTTYIGIANSGTNAERDILARKARMLIAISILSRPILQ